MGLLAAASPSSPARAARAARAAKANASRTCWVSPGTRSPAAAEPELEVLAKLVCTGYK